MNTAPTTDFLVQKKMDAPRKLIRKSVWMRKTPIRRIFVKNGHVPESTAEKESIGVCYGTAVSHACCSLTLSCTKEVSEQSSKRHCHDSDRVCISKNQWMSSSVQGDEDFPLLFFRSKEVVEHFSQTVVPCRSRWLGLRKAEYLIALFIRTAHL